MASGTGTSEASKGAPASSASRCRIVGEGVVELLKGPHVWRFRLGDAGRASARSMLKTLSDYASSASCPLDWFDAAIVADTLSHTKPLGTAGAGPANSVPGPTSGREDETVAW